jgi:hypothetical protein
MGEFFGSVLIGSGLVLFVVALAAVFRPLPKLKMSTRKAAAAGLALSVASCVGGAVLMPNGQEIANAEVAKNVQNPPTESGKAEPMQPNAALQGAIVAQWRAVVEAVQPCDRANDRVVDAIQRVSAGSGSLYDAYARADEGVETCRSAHATLRDLDVPAAAEGQLKHDLSGALQTCGDAYFVRQMALESAKSIFDGDMRPSVVNEFKTQAETAKNGVLACAASYMSAAVGGGVDLEKMTYNS